MKDKRECDTRTSVKELVKEGDAAKGIGKYQLAIINYNRALESTDDVYAKYIVSRLSSCYRKLNQPNKALEIYHNALNQYGITINDPVVLTSVSGAYCDLKRWDEALNCANYACELDDGEINEFLDAVYNRIENNRSYYERWQFA